MSQSYHVIVIGGGHNGLTAAALLARTGRKVLVLERRDILGGMAACEEFHPGYRHTGLLHDTACVWPSVLQKLELSQYGLQRYDHAPPILVPQRAEDGKGLLLYTDPDRATEEIANFSQVDAKQYAAFRKFLGTVQRFVQNVVERMPPPLIDADTEGVLPLFRKAASLRLLGKDLMTELLRAVPMSVEDWLNEWFATDLLKAALAGPAIYGSFTGPRSPASNAPFLLHECSMRTPIRGGAAALTTALAKSAESRGAELRTGTEVARILLQEGRVKGVQTTTGEEILAPVVLASCDPKQTFLQLMPPSEIPYQLEQRMMQFRTRGTTAKVHLALSEQPRFACRPEHPVEFARTGENLVELEKAFDAVKYRQYSQRPILDIYVPTVSNPDLAPEGHSVMSILVHFVPYNLEGGWDTEQKNRLGDIVVETLASYAPEIASSVVAREVLSPVDLEQRYGLTGGHIYHGELGLDQLLVRPIPECARFATPIPGLFLGGNGSHGGVGLTCGPGSLASQAVLRYAAY